MQLSKSWITLLGLLPSPWYFLRIMTVPETSHSVPWTWPQLMTFRITMASEGAQLVPGGGLGELAQGSPCVMGSGPKTSNKSQKVHRGCPRRGLLLTQVFVSLGTAVLLTQFKHPLPSQQILTSLFLFQKWVIFQTNNNNKNLRGCYVLSFNVWQVSDLC